MPRTRKQLAYRAEKERGYRRTKRQERDAALMTFATAEKELIKRHGYSPGQLLDLLLKVEA